MKKTISLLSLIALLANSYWVFAYNNDELNAANSLAEQEIINDKSATPDDYNLDDYVLRQEIAAVSRWVAWLEKKDSCDNIFTDLSSTNPNSWACVNVEPLVDNDLISSNDTFRPEDNITKAESIWMLIKSIGFDYNYDSSNSDGWQKQIVDFAVEKWVVDEFTDYDAEATRWWVFKVADTTIKVDEEEKAAAELEEMKKMEEKEVYSPEAL